MAFFREKSGRIGARIVQAVQFVGNFDEIEQFVGGDAEFRDGKLVAASRQGPLRASHGEWLVLEHCGRFVVYPAHLFVDAFEPAPPGTAVPSPKGASDGEG